MSVKCKFFGHNFKPYRYRWLEYLPTQSTPRVSKEGSYFLSHVYCERCGEVREVSNSDGKLVKYRIPQNNA